jgi:dipeptidyl aminopeptidase/acylaminoacyl peptidase
MRIADPDRVAIFGGSFGGYAALAGAAFTPDPYKCAINLNGAVSVLSMIKYVPPFAGIRAISNSRIGNPDDPADNELLIKGSPLFAADKIKIPLLIALGGNDPRGRQAESEQIVAAIEKNRGRVTYVLYPDEGHVLVRPANNQDFMARVEKLLAEHLGGRCEPMDGERIAGSSAIVKLVGPARKQ